MAIKKIAIVHDNKYTVQEILDDLKDEGFTNLYKVTSTVHPEMVAGYFETCDEVWTFGDVLDMTDYKLAVAMGCDIWKMS